MNPKEFAGTIDLIADRLIEVARKEIEAAFPEADRTSTSANMATALMAAYCNHFGPSVAGQPILQAQAAGFLFSGLQACAHRRPAGPIQ